MTGGLIQLISKGFIDNFIVESPEITFFKSVFHRHTNFAIETYENTFNSSNMFGSISECILKDYGDLISDLIIKIDLPSLNGNVVFNTVCTKEICDCYCVKCHANGQKTIYSWANGIGHVIIDYVELQIGGKVINRHYGEWFEIWTELTQTNEKRPGYYEMIGKKEPINFSFSSFTGTMSLYVPLNFWFCRNIGYALPISALYYEDVVLRIKWNDFNKCYVSNNNSKIKSTPLFSASLLTDYVFLDIEERSKFLSDKLMYIFDQVQFIENFFNKSIKNPKFDLSSIQKPVKELIWALQRDDIDNDWYNYGNNKNRLIVKGAVNDTFLSGKIILNGVERFREMKSQWFRLVQPYKFHTRVPTNYIYNYCFSLKPEELQPTGSCNFSMFTNVYLYLYGVQIPVDYIIKLWAVNQNILLISDGISGIAEF